MYEEPERTDKVLGFTQMFGEMKKEMRPIESGSSELGKKKRKKKKDCQSLEFHIGKYKNKIKKMSDG